jgi:hypothetical protein
MRDSGSKLAHDPEPEGAGRSAQILSFPTPERLAAKRSGIPIGEPEDVESVLLDDLAQYEQDRDEGEDLNYTHRMLMNAIALAVIALLVGAGVWIADTMGQLQRDQDCLMQGRSNCSPIEVASPNAAKK